MKRQGNHAIHFLVIFLWVTGACTSSTKALTTTPLPKTPPVRGENDASNAAQTITTTNGGDTVGVFRSSPGTFYLKNTNTSGFADIVVNYGLAGDYPLVGDWNGDGIDTLGVYRNGIFLLRNSNTSGLADMIFAFGVRGDQPVAGDWNGDGQDTIGVYRNGIFYLRNSNDSGVAEVSFGLGNPGDIGIAGDWNGDGTDTTGVFRPSNGMIFLKNANTTGIADVALNYGLPGDKPVMGDWNNDGIDTVGVYRNGTFYLRNSNTIGFAEIVFELGISGDRPVAGKASTTLIQGSTYYVSPGGNDANQGTQTNPWRTIQKAVQTVKPGDTILVRGGIYHESVKITRSGWASLPIKLTRYDNETVIIDGGINRALYAYTSTPQYWIIEGLRLVSTNVETVVFDSWGCDGTCNGVDHWTFRNNYIGGAIKIYGAYNLLEGNEVDGSANNGNGGNGIQDMYDASHHNIFRNNIVHDFSERGIWSMHRTHDDLFEGNTIYNIDNMCLNTDGFGTVEWRHRIRGNHIYNCGRGIHLENTFAGVVENNLIHDVALHGVSVINYGATIPSPGTKKCEVGGESNQYGDVDGNNDCEGTITNDIIRQNVIYNTGLDGGFICYHAGGIKLLGNTIIGNSSSKWGVWLDSKYCPQFEMQSNIFAGHSESEILLLDYALITVDSNNLFYNSNPNNIYQRSDGQTYWQYQSVSQYQTTSGKGSGSLFGDPRFANSLAGNFRLRLSSPAIDRGAFLGLLTDSDGTIRPQGTAYDIGAYELPAP